MGKWTNGGPTVAEVKRYEVGVGLQTKIDLSPATAVYIGKAQVGEEVTATAWQLKKITLLATSVDIQWADGDSDFDNVYADRASDSYS